MFYSAARPLITRHPLNRSDVPFSSIRLFGCTRFHAGLQSFPDPVAISLKSFARLSIPYMSGHEFLCRLPFRQILSLPPNQNRGSTTCARLSQPLSNMPDKTSQWHRAVLRRPTCLVDDPRQEQMGFLEFYSTISR